MKIIHKGIKLILKKYKCESNVCWLDLIDEFNRTTMMSLNKKQVKRLIDELNKIYKELK